MSVKPEAKNLTFNFYVFILSVKYSIQSYTQKVSECGQDMSQSQIVS